MWLFNNINNKLQQQKIDIKSYKQEIKTKKETNNIN